MKKPRTDEALLSLSDDLRARADRWAGEGGFADLDEVEAFLADVRGKSAILTNEIWKFGCALSASAFRVSSDEARLRAEIEKPVEKKPSKQDEAKAASDPADPATRWKLLEID